MAYHCIAIVLKYASGQEAPRHEVKKVMTIFSFKFKLMVFYLESKPEAEAYR